ncbi:MAG: S1C family serine protease [Clostridiales bacterium]|nr:S1C family serine protease [Clostridiales bacterium]
MKKRVCVAIVSAALAGALAMSLCGCFGGEDTANTRNPYEIAGSLGYDGSEKDFLSESTGSSTELRKLYDEARADGYTGSFVDFLKELNISLSGDDSAQINAALTSVVSIVCPFTKIEYIKTDWFGSTQKQETTITSAGSGVIYSLDRGAGDAYIITNYHVVYSAESGVQERICAKPSVYLYGGEISSGAISASYVGGAMDYDIAVLKVEGSKLLKESSATAAVAVDSDAIVVGEKVYAVGNAKGNGISVSSGIVSVDKEYIEIKASDNTRTISLLEIRTDATVNHGNSGGGLFNADGKLMGIVNAKREEDGVEGMGYAIPSNLALAITQNIIDNSAVNKSRGASRATLGITMKTQSSKAVYDEATCRTYIMETLVVDSVTSGSVADGKLKAGDVLYSIKVGNGQEKLITRMHVPSSELFNVRKGDTVTIVVSRGDELIAVDMVFNNDAQFTVYS